MRRRVISGVGALVLAAGLLVVPMSGTAFAKKGPGSKECSRAQAKLAKDQAKNAPPNKIAEDEKRVAKACGGTSTGSSTSTSGGGGGGGGHFGSQECEA